MNAQAINFVFAALGAAGLFFLVGGATGRLRLSLGRRPGSLSEYGGEARPLELPLAVRLAQSLTDGAPLWRLWPGR